MRVLYQAPTAVKTDEETRTWLAEWTQTVIAECRDPGLLQRSWVEFKRTYAKAFWPAPGLLCETIRSVRAEEARYNRAPNGGRLAAPDYHKPELVSQATRNATLLALAEADNMAASTIGMEAALGRALTTLGLSIIDRNGQPRSDA